MSQLIVWALCLVMLTPSSWGRSPARVEPFQQYVDHLQFTQLSSDEQKAFIISVMETMAEMEQEVIDADKILTLDHMQKMQLREKKKALNQLKEIFEQFSHNIAIPNAYARAVPASSGPQYCSASARETLKNKHAKNERNELITCMYGTYMSNMVRDGSKYYCARPACSGSPEFSNAHNNAARDAGCSPAQMVCNPSIYGKNTQTRKASCVTLDFPGALPGSFENIAHNVSLACLMEVTNDPNSDLRLSQIAQSIINPSSGSKENAANNFNRMLSIITNVCLCGDVGFNNKSLNYYEQNFDSSYVQYLNGHRSCNALLSQMQLLTGKIAQTANYCTQNTFLPPNLANFSSTISQFSAFSNRVNNYMSTRDTNWDPKNPAHRSRAMRLLKDRWIVSNASGLSGSKQVVEGYQALDKVFSEQDLSSWKQKICPLRIDPPPSDPTCTITVNSQSRLDPLALTLNASASVKDANGAEAEASLVWKLNDKTIETQTGKIFASSVRVEADVVEFSLKAQATIAGKKIECTAATFTANIPQDPTKPSCNLSANSGTFTIESGKFALSALPTATPNPANLQGALVWYYSDAEVNPAEVAASADATSVTLVGKYKLEGAEPIECGVVTYTKAEGAPQPKPPKKCVITISSPTSTTPKPADNKPFAVAAEMSLLDENDGEVEDVANATIKWMLNGAEVAGQTATAFEGSSPSRALKLSAKINDITCPEVSVADEVVEKPKEEDPKTPKSCSVSVTQAPAGPGLFSVEASVAPTPDKDTAVAFSGLTELKPVEGQAGVARGNIAGIAQAQKKKVKAKYKSGGADLECEGQVEIPAAQGQAPVNNQQQPFMPPAEPGFLLQKRGVN